MTKTELLERLEALKAEQGARACLGCHYIKPECEKTCVVIEEAIKAIKTPDEGEEMTLESVYGEIVENKNGKLHTTGRSRTGCVFCGFGAHLEKEPNRFQMLKQTHPKFWNYCMKP